MIDPGCRNLTGVMPCSVAMLNSKSGIDIEQYLPGQSQDKSADCDLFLIPPGNDPPRRVHFEWATEGEFTSVFKSAGVYEVVLVVEPVFAKDMTGWWWREKSNPFDSARQTEWSEEDNRVDMEWLDSQPRQARLTVEAGAPAWKLVETDMNPYDLSVESDLHTDNASFAGSFKECNTTNGSITYWHVAKTQAADLANVVWTYTFDQPPDEVQPGEVITLVHSLRVDGEVKEGGGYAPTGRAGYSTDFHAPRNLSVPSFALNDERFSITDGDVVQVWFPTSGNWFGIEARVLDTQEPDIACDIAWWYRR